jgi:5'-AMP-activated protein kinase, regulatory beta subunit
LVLPSGVYHYRIIVDGELRYIPELPHAADERGRVANVLDVHVSKNGIIQTCDSFKQQRQANYHLSFSSVFFGQDYVPESLDSVAEFEAPPSPVHSYDLHCPGDEEFAKEPPTLPPQLLVSVLGGDVDSAGHGNQALKPQHVVLDHLFIEKGWGSQSLLALGVTHRFESKYVSFVLYKPLER